MLRFRPRAMLLVPIVFMLAACDEDTMEPEIQPTPEELEATDPDAAVVSAIEEIANGLGFTESAAFTQVSETDEAPAFGSSVFAAAFDEPESAALTTDLATDSMVTALPADRAHVYDVLAVWGRIRPNANTDALPTVWDPALHVAEGDAVRVRRALLFESGDEVHPQEERSLVTMSSGTGPHIDGVAAQVLIVKPDAVSVDDVAPPEQYLGFRSAPYTVQIPAEELGDLRVAEVIDDSGNGVLLASLMRYPDPCGAGFMKGRWARTNENGGVFGGVWVQKNGRREGYLAGRWGINAEGERVFRAKIVNAQGDFLAIMAGTYGAGAYEGEIYGRGRVLLGHVRGRYTGEDSQGTFLGGWKQACDTDEPERVCQLTDAGVRVCSVIPTDPVPTG